MTGQAWVRALGIPAVIAILAAIAAWQGIRAEGLDPALAAVLLVASGAGWGCSGTMLVVGWWISTHRPTPLTDPAQQDPDVR